MFCDNDFGFFVQTKKGRSRVLSCPCLQVPCLWEQDINGHKLRQIKNGYTPMHCGLRMVLYIDDVLVIGSTFDVDIAGSS